MLTAEQLLKIEQDAQKATPGPWDLCVHTGDGTGGFDPLNDDWTLSNVGKSIVAWEQDDIQKSEDVVHIANCDPQTVIDLVKMARRSIELEAELSEQCRLLGAGSEREARLMARVAELESINSQRKKGGEG